MADAFKLLPKNYLADWGEMESWALGTGSAPDGWTIGTTASIAQETSAIKFGSYAARVIGSTGALGGIYRTIPNGEDYNGRTFKLGVWGQSSSTGPYIEINDGVTSSTLHLDGSGAYVFYTTPGHKIDYAATQITIGLWSSVTATAYYDGAVLCQGEDLFTKLTGNKGEGIDAVISQFSPTIEMRQDVYDIAGREGAYIPHTHLVSKPISVEGTVAGSDQASARTHFDNLMKGVLAWQNDEKRSFYLNEDRVMDVFLNNLNWDYGGTNFDYITYRMEMTAADSKSRYIARLRNRTVIAASVTEFNFAYNGNANSLPVISFVADQGAAITTCQLENITTGENITYSGTVPTNVALDIDCDLGTVFNSSVNKIADFGTSDFIKLVRGTNYFRFSGSNCTINIDYYEKYL